MLSTDLWNKLNGQPLPGLGLNPFNPIPEFLDSHCCVARCSYRPLMV